MSSAFLIKCKKTLTLCKKFAIIVTMETPNKRIIAVRKALDMKQGEFAEKMGVKQATLSMIELGNNPVSDRYVKLICLTFGVSEQWLREGVGEMFVDKAQQSIKELLDIFDRLSPASRKMILDLARAMLTNEQPA
jgi:transcriptional regulator with XRE-family HTH domain